MRCCLPQCRNGDDINVIAMGRDVLWITAASILAAFDISNAVDREGKALDPSTIEYTNSMSRCV